MRGVTDDLLPSNRVPFFAQVGFKNLLGFHFTFARLRRLHTREDITMPASRRRASQ
jgi:hypothetical protein